MAFMLTTNRCEKAPAFCLDDRSVRQFCGDLLEVDGKLRTLSDTRDDATVAYLTSEFSNIFSGTIGKIGACLQDTDCGIVAIDIPSIYQDLTDDAIAGALVSIALTSSLMQPTKDIENLTPFTMFSASNKSNDALNQAGLLEVSPTDILGFHSDGVVRGNALGIPNLISIYNIFINYRICGNFYWIPTSSIPNFSGYVEKIGFDDDYVFSLTPSVYGVPGEKIDRIEDRKVQTSIFKQTDTGDVATFMNGSFIGKKSNGQESNMHFHAFHSALSENPFRYAAAQKPRRMIVLNNGTGFHARDIFEAPLEGHEETRCYLRSVSKDAIMTGHVL